MDRFYQGPDMERYQGIVPLDGNTLAEAAHTYFAQSEQIPTQAASGSGPAARAGRQGAKLAGRRHHGAAFAEGRRGQSAAVFIRRRARGLCRTTARKRQLGESETAA